MKFMVLGASGFIGRHTYHHLRNMGYETIGTQRQVSEGELLSFDLETDQIKNCIPQDFLQGTETCYAIICAAFTQTDRCVKEKELSRKINVDNTVTLIHDLIDLNIKPVFLSTSAVFDGTTGYYVESDQQSPLSEYSRQKTEVEQYLHNNLPEVLVIRLDKVMGTDPDEKHLLTEWYRQITNSEKIMCIDDQVFAPTDVEDVAEGILLACEYGCTGFYHLANTEYFNRAELARQFMYAVGERTEILSIPQSEIPLLEPRPPKSYLDSSKLIAETGMRFTSARQMFTRFLKNMSGGKSMSDKDLCFRRPDCRLSATPSASTSATPAPTLQRYSCSARRRP